MRRGFSVEKHPAGFSVNRRRTLAKSILGAQRRLLETSSPPRTPVQPALRGIRPLPRRGVACFHCVGYGVAWLAVLQSHVEPNRHSGGRVNSRKELPPCSRKAGSYAGSGGYHAAQCTRSISLTRRRRLSLRNKSHRKENGMNTVAWLART